MQTESLGVTPDPPPRSPSYVQSIAKPSWFFHLNISPSCALPPQHPSPRCHCPSPGLLWYLPVTLHSFVTPSYLFSVQQPEWSFKFVNIHYQILQCLSTTSTNKFVFLRLVLKVHQDLNFSFLSCLTLWGRGEGYGEPSNMPGPSHLELLVFPEVSRSAKPQANACDSCFT